MRTALNMSSDNIQIFTSNSSTETERIAADFAKTLKNGDFVAMYGDLGAGKTAFVRGMGSVLCPEDFISSPTYTIVNEYQGANARLCHFDMYRISDDDDLYSIGFYDYSDCIIVCEWSENIEFALPDRYYRVTIEKVGESTRNITIEEHK